MLNAQLLHAGAIELSQGTHDPGLLSSSGGSVDEEVGKVS